MEYVGRAAFLHFQTDEEIIEQLRPKKISISPSEIAYLEKRFIVYVALAHSQSAQRIREAIEARGGYILHLDGTCEGASPLLMSGLDEISGIVLHNVKIPTESAESIIPFLERIEGEYGTPLAVVSDMGSGIDNALTEVFPGVPHLLCHFHFLRDIGKDLLGKEYDTIRTRLRELKTVAKLRERARALKHIIDDNPELVDLFHSGIENKQLLDSLIEFAPVVSTYSLILWTLDGKNQGKGYGYPFDRPYVTFVQRLCRLRATVEKLRDIRLRGEWRDNRPFFKLFLDLKEVTTDKVLQEALVGIESKIEVFDRFRDAMRITVDEQRGLNDEGDGTDMKTIEEGVEKFCDWLEHDPRYKENDGYEKMIKQIRQYWKRLFADPITVDTPKGRVIIYPQRTNNILERFFREIKRGYRRKTGTTSLSRKLRAMLADTPLVKNLENEEYVKIILNGRASLAELFSEIDAKTVRKELRKSQEYSDQIPPKIRSVIKKADLPKIVTKLFTRRAAAC
ncbi:MAG: transposase [Candidatus Thorarchaeota archaeon]